MIPTFDVLTAWQGSSQEYRAAKLALLTMRVRRTIERTDAAARKIEEAAAGFTDDVTSICVRRLAARLGTIGADCDEFD